MISYLVSICLWLPCQKKALGLLGKRKPILVVISWRSKPSTWPIKEHERYIQSITCEWLKPRMVLLTPLLNLLHCNTVYYNLHDFSARSDVANCDLNPVLDEKGIVAFGKSRSYSSFVFPCSRTPVIATSFSFCCRKHGDVSRHPSVQIRIIGVQIIENPLYCIAQFINNKLSGIVFQYARPIGTLV